MQSRTENMYTCTMHWALQLVPFLITTLSNDCISLLAWMTTHTTSSTTTSRCTSQLVGPRFVAAETRSITKPHPPREHFCNGYLPTRATPRYQDLPGPDCVPVVPHSAPSRQTSTPRQLPTAGRQCSSCISSASITTNKLPTFGTTCAAFSAPSK